MDGLFRRAFDVLGYEKIRRGGLRGRGERGDRRREHEDADDQREKDQRRHTGAHVRKGRRCGPLYQFAIF